MVFEGINTYFLELPLNGKISDLSCLANKAKCDKRQDKK